MEYHKVGDRRVESRFECLDSDGNVLYDEMHKPPRTGLIGVSAVLVDTEYHWELVKIDQNVIDRTAKGKK